MPRARRKPGAQQIKICGRARAQSEGLDIAIPLGMLVAITGVSGSGKSTLLHDVLYQALAQRPSSRPTAAAQTATTGTSSRASEFIDEVVLVDQSPIGRTPRSNPVTYIKAFDAIRELFASLPEAKKRGFAAGTFFLQHSRRPLRDLPGRRHGHGGDAVSGRRRTHLRRVQGHALQAAGARGSLSREKYPRSVEYDGEGSAAFFRRSPEVVDKLRVLDEVGLGYLRLGQSATTLSGGEAQRMKLARTCSRTAAIGPSRPTGPRRRPRVLYIFDEPTTGLHFDDVSKLLSPFAA